MPSLSLTVLEKWEELLKPASTAASVIETPLKIAWNAVLNLWCTI